jgi:hypothetical protein
MKKFTLTITEDDLGDITATSTNEGFANAHIIGYLQIGIMQMANEVLNTKPKTRKSKSKK